MKKIYLLLFGLIMASALQAKTIQLSIAPFSKVLADRFNLAEIINPSGLDREDLKNLNRIEIGISPKPGESRILTKSYLEHKLSGLGKDYRFFIPPSVKIMRDSMEIKGSRIADVVLEDFSGLTGIPVSELGIFGAVNDVSLPNGELKYSLERPSQFEDIRNHVTYRMNFLVDGRKEKTIFVKVRRNLRGSVAQPADFSESSYQPERNTSSYGIGQLAQNNVNLQNRQVNSNRRTPRYGESGYNRNDNSQSANSNLTEPISNKPNRADIQSGRNVRVIYNSSSIRLETLGILRTSGNVGEIVDVINTATKKLIRAIVIDSNTVEAI